MSSVSPKMLTDLLNWRVAVDILLIAWVIYFAYRTLHRLGTWKIVAGVFIAIAIFVFADTLGLTGIRWVYSNLSHVAIVALIVIFQPELRKTFERAASFRRKEIGDHRTSLSVLIADVVFALSEQRRGAIIVFPGKEPIKEWLSGGISVNADPSFPLLMSIFDPNSPGHDGAVVFDNGKW